MPAITAGKMHLMGTAESHGSQLTRFLEREWDALGTTRGAWCRSIGLSPSTALRWSRDAEPDLKNLQLVANALGYRLVEILHAAGYIDEADMRARTVSAQRERLSIEDAIRTDRSISRAERDTLLAVHAGFRSVEPAKRRGR